MRLLNSVAKKNFTLVIPEIKKYIIYFNGIKFRLEHRDRRNDIMLF